MKKLFNAKSGTEANPFIFKSKDSLEFLTTIQEKILEVDRIYSIQSVVKREPPVLNILTNQDVPARMDKYIELTYFGVPVHMEVVSV